MDMKEKEIIHTALENLFELTQIKGTWVDNPPGILDGQVILIADELQFTLNTEIKRELRNYQIHQLQWMAEKYHPFLIVAERIYPKIKEELRKRNIAYLETNGNIFLKEKGIHLYVDVKKPIQQERIHGNRAFTKTGLKVLFHFLLRETLINLPHREIAVHTKVAHGNIAYVLKGLKETGFLLKLNKDQFQLTRKKELLEKWMVAYQETLKPALNIGTFRFLKENDFINWKNIQLVEGKTCWGGEPAGDILTNYLRPGELTLYTTENRNDFIKNYRMIPDPLGNIKVYKKFWNNELEAGNPIVPPLLIYADLINTGEKRCLETGEKIFLKYVEPNL